MTTPDHTHARYPRLVLWTMLLGASVVLSTATSTMAALPDLGQRLHASQTQLQWIVDINPVLLAALVIPFGALLDRYGRRRGLVAGLLLLMVSLVWSATAGSPTSLLLSRALTGVAAAAVFPGTLATLTAVTPAAGRPRAVGLWAAATFAGGTWGLLLSSGLLETNLSGGAFFAATAGVAAVCLAGTLIAVPETREAHVDRLDPLGALLSLVGIGALVLGIIELPVRGLGDPVVAGGLATGVLGLAGFVAWELRAPHPMLDVRLFRRPDFAGGAAGVFLLYLGSYGYFLMVFQYFPYTRGFSAFQTALCIIPNAVSTLPCAVLAPRLSARYGWARVEAFALAISGVATLAMVAAGPSRSIVLLSASFFVYGIGLGLGGSPATQAIVDGLPRSKQGVASAVNDAGRELGAAVGIAIMGAAFNFGYRGHLGTSVEGVPPQVVHAARDSPAIGVQIAAGAQGAGGRLSAAIGDATVVGWQAAFAVGSLVFLGAAALIWRGVPRPALGPAGLAADAPADAAA